MRTAPDSHRNARRHAIGWGGFLLLAGSALLLGSAQPAAAQREVPKIGSICPLGYVDLFNGRCSTLGLMNYTVQPTRGEACPSGWMNVGGGYCREKK
jgi:hypothetical protein